MEVDLEELGTALTAVADDIEAKVKSALTNELLKDIGEAVARTAKSRLGSYAGNDWPPLSEATKYRRERDGYPPDDPLLVTGGLRASIRTTVQRPAVYIGSNAPQARIQELGGVTPRAVIPPRPYLKPSLVEREDDIIRKVAIEVADKLET